MNSKAYLERENLFPAFQDQFGRVKRKLRISVTDRCNFKCVYCMPEHPEWMKKHDLLSFEELYSFCEFMVKHGVEQIRITGGEPLMRQGVVHFIKQLQALRAYGLQRISMTSNGHYLKKYSQALKQAGLDDLNISLDSLNPTQFETLTQKSLEPVLDGIYAAKEVGLNIKINTVLIKGLNEDQIIPLVKWAHAQQFEPRFIEFMPLDGEQNWSADAVVTEQEILDVLKTEYSVQVLQGHDAAPARSYMVNDMPIGIISTISNSFCGTCDRLRLNAQGEFFNCLFSTQGIPLKALIQAQMNCGNTQNSALKEVLSPYIWHKEQGFHAIQEKQNSTLNSKPSTRKISMYMIGG